MTNELIYTDDDVLRMLDTLLAGRGSDWWNGFYEDRAKACPFFVECPDENLAQWVDTQLVRPGRAVDLGCGNGRNGIFLARRGFAVDGVDYSRKAIDWAAERVRQAGVSMHLRCQSVFELGYAPGRFDLVYDSGCFHHLPPHRRRAYVEMVAALLKPGGWLGLTCFRPEGGSGYSDRDVYERRSLGGGLGYTEAQLREIWSHGLHVHAIRRMRKQGEGSEFFGVDFLWVLIARKLP